MPESERRHITSQVVGVVYTDLVCYVIPGFLLLGACIAAWGIGSEALAWASKLTAGAGLVVTLSLAALSFSLGIGLSSIRWFGVTRGGNASFGKLIHGKVPRSVLRRLPLPPAVLQEARRRIRRDLKDLGLIDNETHDFLQTADANWDQSGQREDARKTEQLDRDLMDSYWHVMRGNLRESSLNLFPYLDRWRDIEAGRENMLVACQVAFFSLIVRAWLRSQPSWSMVALGAAGFFLIMAVRRWLLPRYTYYLMFPVLLRYLVGDLTKSVTDSPKLEEEQALGRSA